MTDHERLSIAHITSSLQAPLGGAEAYCVRLAEKQARVHSVTVITPAIDAKTRERLCSSGVVVVESPVWRPYRSDQRGSSLGQKMLFHGLDAWGAIRSPRGYRSRDLDSQDILHIHRFQGIGAAILRPRGRARVVHTVHDFALVDTQGSAARKGKPISRLGIAQRARALLNLRSARHADAILFPSQRTLERHVSLGLKRDWSRDRQLPLGWEVATASEVRSTEPTLPYLLFVGKLTRQKGLDVLLEAWGDGFPGFELLVAGDGALVEDVVDRHGVGVKFVGWIDGPRKSALISNALAVVFPSQWPENFPLVVAEAMLLGTPIVTNPLAAGPLPSDRVNALIADDTGAASLRQTIRSLLGSPELGEELRQGAENTGDQLSMPIHLDRVEHVYREVLVERHG